MLPGKQFVLPAVSFRSRFIFSTNLSLHLKFFNCVVLNVETEVGI